MGGIASTINKVKYIGIACLTIAILSTLILNIISSYSSSKVNSNAEPATQSTNGTLVSGPASISLSLTPIITPTSSQCDTSNSNICMSIPDSGGIATGGHTVEVNNTSITGKADLALTSSNADWALESDNHSDFTIRPISLDPVLGNPSASLTNATWGIALFTPNNPDINSSLTDILGDEQNFIDSSNNETSWFPPSVVEAGESFENSTLSSINFYYGVYIDDPSATPAGNYSIDLIYTATVMLPESPAIDGITPSGYELNSSADSAATITGTNLASTYKVYLESDADTNINYDLTNSITRVTDDEIKVTLPTDKTNPELEAGNYTIYVVTQGGEASVGFAYTKKALPDGILESTDDYRNDGRVAVDYDENMIPVTYTGNGSSPQWTALPKSEISSNPKSWYDYPNKIWANAVTVKDPTKYNDIATRTTVDNADILGYWVYIPRYAYEVQRRDTSDAPVQPQNFNIVFQTSDQMNTPVKTCSTANNNKDYRTGCNIDTTYTVNSDDTTWATHPAFNWKYNQASNGFDEVIKLNGIWVGKFETSETDAYTTPESQTTALILPGVEANGTHFGWALESIKRIGIKDTLNTGGGIQNSTNPEESWPWNSNHLAISSAHLMKNSEWGAVSYLTSSAFGIGIGNLKGNVHYELTGLGPTSKAYYYEDSWPASTTGNIYGIYDMKGGRRETLAAAFSSDGIQSDQGYGSIISTPLRNTMREPYADLYPASIFPARENNGIDFCTWETCGGQALHETLLQQYSNNEDIFSWLSEDTGRSQFPTASSPWIERNYYLADDSRGEMDDMYRFFSETPAGSSSGNGYRAVVLPANLSPIQN